MLHLRHGCCTATASSDDGIVRHHVTGLHFKGVTDNEGSTITAGEIRDQPWTVIAPVATAITVLEWPTNPHLGRQPGASFPALRDGEHVSSPAAERYQAGAAEFTTTYHGTSPPANTARW